MKVFYPEIGNNSPTYYHNNNKIRDNRLNVPSFKGANNTNNTLKIIKLKLKWLADYMKNPSEITNAFIAAIGTGAIAPAIILCSPGKGDKQDKDKKNFQALRQPLSAVLALAFQLPATMGINRLFNHLAYVKHIKLFKEDGFGDLIPDKMYLRGKVTKEEIQELSQKFDEIDSKTGKSLRQELEEKTKEDYKDVNWDASDEDITKKVEKKKEKFLREKIADRKYDELINKKVDELKSKNIVIKDKELITEDIALEVEHWNKEELKAVEKEANLSVFDKVIKLMGFENKKIKEVKSKQDKIKEEKGFEKVRNQNLSDTDKLRRYVEYKNKKALKLFENKKFWISLGINLFMVTASCYALNWAHPRFKELIDKMSGKNKDESNKHNNTPQKKVEVNA